MINCRQGNRPERNAMAGLNRRELTMAGLALGAASPARAATEAATLTVGQVLDRMHGQIGTPWFERGVDRIIAGDADTPVTGIATTMMGTFDAFKAAAAAGCNLVITHEPTFCSHQDTVTQLQDDPLYKIKLGYLKAHRMVSFHFHDHWHAKLPIDGIHQGMADRMGWSSYLTQPYDRHINLPPTTLGGLARTVQRKLGDRTLRVVGDPDLAVKRIAVSWGNCSLIPGAPFLNSDCDALVIGEEQDWDLIAYAQDLVTAGRRKGLIVLGHVLSEQWGMEYAASWLKTFVTEVPVRFVPLIEPYWNLKKPVFEINTRMLP
jgi:putative NIF3 family GTP cyclohydrolase 1 type 2